MKFLKEVKPLWNLIREEKKKLIFACALIILCGFADLFYGYLNGLAIESITKLAIKDALIYLGIYGAIEFFSEGIIYTLAKSILESIESKLTRKIENYCYEKAISLPAYAYEEHSSGEMINRITNDASSLSFIFSRILNLIISIVVSIIIFFYILANSWIVALEIIIIVTILLFILKRVNPKVEEAHKNRKKEHDRFSSLTNESIRGIREIKTLGIKNNLLFKVKNILEDLYSKSLEEIRIRQKFTISTKLLRTTLEISAFITCMILMYYNQISLTFLVAMTYYIYRYTYLIDTIDEFSQEFQKIKVSIERTNDLILNRLYEDDKFGNVSKKDIKGVIEFKNVTFGYPNEKALLKNFNIKIEPGKKIAFVGQSGQGKSTIFNLLTRIFDNTKGRILIDGINIKDFDEQSLRENISIIRQEPFVFNSSVKNNFKIVNKDIKLPEIRTYCKMAYIDDYIMSLPKKYNTILGEGGVNLSGGQKQRLAIARTLSKKSKIILFDEATSALDNNSQEYIKKAIDELSKDHTVITVAHRLSTIKDADIIYVVDKGKVVDYGKHDYLLKNCETYKNLYFTESL